MKIPFVERRSAGEQYVTMNQRDLVSFLGLYLRTAAEPEETKTRLQVNKKTGIADEDGLKSFWLSASEDFERKGVDLHNVKVSLVFMDVKNFKREVNDPFGWDVGDRVLREVAGVLEGSLRKGDLAVNPHGDEFMALVMGGDRAVKAVLDRFNRKMGKLEIVGQAGEGHYKVKPQLKTGYKSMTLADSLEEAMVGINRDFFRNQDMNR